MTKAALFLLSCALVAAIAAASSPSQIPINVPNLAPEGMVYANSTLGFLASSTSGMGLWYVQNGQPVKWSMTPSGSGVTLRSLGLAKETRRVGQYTAERILVTQTDIPFFGLTASSTGIYALLLSGAEAGYGRSSNGQIFCGLNPSDAANRNQYMFNGIAVNDKGQFWISDTTTNTVWSGSFQSNGDCNGFITKLLTPQNQPILSTVIGGLDGMKWLPLNNALIFNSNNGTGGSLLTYQLDSQYLQEVVLMNATTGERHYGDLYDGIIAAHFDNGLGGAIYMTQDTGMVLKIQGGSYGFGDMKVLWITNQYTVPSTCKFPSSVDVQGSAGAVYVSCAQNFVPNTPVYYFQKVDFSQPDQTLPITTLYQPGLIPEGIAYDWPLGTLVSSIGGQGVQLLQAVPLQAPTLRPYAKPFDMGSSVGIRPDPIRSRMLVCVNPQNGTGFPGVYAFHSQTGIVLWKNDFSSIINSQNSQNDLINDLTVDSMGNIYATDWSATNGQVFKVSADGQTSSSWLRLPANQGGNGITVYKPFDGNDLIIIGINTFTDGNADGGAAIRVAPANNPAGAYDLAVSGTFGGLDGLYLDDFTSTSYYTLWVVGNPTHTIYKIRTTDFQTASVVNSEPVPPACNAGQQLGATTGALVTPQATGPGPAPGSFFYVCTRGFTADGIYPIYHAVFKNSDKGMIQTQSSTSTQAIDYTKVDENRAIAGTGLGFALFASLLSIGALLKLSRVAAGSGLSLASQNAL